MKSIGLGALFLVVFVTSQFETAFANENYGLFEVDQLVTTPIFKNKIKKIQRASVALVHDEEFQAPEIKRFNQKHLFCSTREHESALAMQPSWTDCSGTLISPRHVLTAGHCVVSQESCASLNLVFDYNKESDIEKIREDKNLVYRCQRVVLHKRPPGSWDLAEVPLIDPDDYAVIELDRPVNDRQPVELKASGSQLSESIFAFTFPFGLPLKISAGYRDRIITGPSAERAEYFNARAMNFLNSSGGGVFDAKFDLIGILVRGYPSFDSDTFGAGMPRCVRIRDCTQGSCDQIQVQKLEAIIQFFRGRENDVR